MNPILFALCFLITSIKASSLDTKSNPITPSSVPKKDDEAALISLRKATEADYCLFEQCYPEILEDAPTPTKSLWKTMCLPTMMIIQLRQSLQPENPGKKVSEEKDIGYIYGFPRLQGQFYVENFVVMPEYRSRGFGSAVLQQYRQSLRSAGFTELTLYCDVGHEKAVVFYAKNGFKAAASMTHMKVKHPLKLLLSDKLEGKLMKTRLIGAEEFASVESELELPVGWIKHYEYMLNRKVIVIEQKNGTKGVESIVLGGVAVLIPDKSSIVIHATTKQNSLLSRAQLMRAMVINAIPLYDNHANDSFQLDMYCIEEGARELFEEAFRGDVEAKVAFSEQFNLLTIPILNEEEKENKPETTAKGSILGKRKPFHH